MGRTTFPVVLTGFIRKDWLIESQGKTKSSQIKPSIKRLVLVSLAHPSWYSERPLNEPLVRSKCLFFSFNGIWGFWSCLFSFHSLNIHSPAIMALSVPGFPIHVHISFCAPFFELSFSSLHLCMELTQDSAPDHWNFLFLLGPQGVHISSLTVPSLESPTQYLKLCMDTSHSLSSFLLQSYHSTPP